MRKGLTIVLLVSLCLGCAEAGKKPRKGAVQSEQVKEWVPGYTPFEIARKEMESRGYTCKVELFDREDAVTNSLVKGYLGKKVGWANHPSEVITNVGVLKCDCATNNALVIFDLWNGKTSAIQITQVFAVRAE